ncbi:MAG: exosortase B [Zoogloeaceae bacterium]|nr:exosortase B [Zoogloeaceae bacterium]
MTTTASAPAIQSPSRADLAPWLIVLLGLAVMYVPSFIDLFRTIWSTDEQAHGPIVLGLSLWLVSRKWAAVNALPASDARPALAWPMLVFAGLLYALGRSQGILIFEVGSLVWMIVGLLLLLRGPAAVRLMWFALFFMLFMIPLPGIVVDTLTAPMKMAVSYVAEQILYAAGYPIARTGVMLQIGQYQLLVADACAGLHTLFTLEALGLLYLNVVRHASVLRNISLAILIVPISFTANVIRVMVLTLITYHWGDEAGQGFLHGFSGMVLFVSALLLIIAADSALRFGVKGRLAA